MSHEGANTFQLLELYQVKLWNVNKLFINLTHHNSTIIL